MIELLSSQEQTGTFEDYFGFRETPFGATPDPRFFYANPLYLEGLAALVYGIKAKKGLMLLTGEVGTGKQFCCGSSCGSSIQACSSFSSPAAI